MKPDLDAPMCDQLGYITMLNVFFDKCELLFHDRGRQVRDDQAGGGRPGGLLRYPSQGVDSALSIKVKRALKWEFSARVPLDVRKSQH